MNPMRAVKVLLFLLPVFLSFFLFVERAQAIVVQKSNNKPAEINSYELFWPIVPGRVSGDALYPLKLFKEKIRGFFILSSIKKAEYNLFLSEKRVVELEKLVLINKDQANGAKTLTALKSSYEKVVLNYNKTLVGKMPVSSTGERIVKSFDNQALLLETIMAKADANQKESIKEIVSFLNLEISKIH